MAAAVDMCVFLCVAAYRGVLNNPTKAVRDTLVNQCAQILACYRKNCASPSSAGQVLKIMQTTHPPSHRWIPAAHTETTKSISVFWILCFTFTYFQVTLCVYVPADPPRVHEAVTGLSELCAEERRAASGKWCLIGRQGLLETADQLHGRCREPRLLLPPPAATGETPPPNTHTHTQQLITSPTEWLTSVLKNILLNKEFI